MYLVVGQDALVVNIEHYYELQTTRGNMVGSRQSSGSSCKEAPWRCEAAMGTPWGSWVRVCITDVRGSGERAAWNPEGTPFGTHCPKPGSEF